MLGFGLIGGSIARALRRSGSRWRVAAWSPSGGGPEAARAEGLIDTASASAGDAIDGAEIVVLAAPPLACLALLDELDGSLGDRLGGDAIVTDVASTKGAIVDRAEARRVRFVGGHPMAGREAAGFDAARADLFDGRPWVIVPAATAKPGDEGRIESLALACGGRPIAMSASEHDAAAAAISHLPLVVAAALVEAVAGPGDDPARSDWPAAAALASSGWQGMTRLARGDVEMGAGIAATNAAALSARLRDLRLVLDGWLAELERAGGPDTNAILVRLAAARDRLAEEDR